MENDLYFDMVGHLFDFRHTHSANVRSHEMKLIQWDKCVRYILL